MLKYLQLQLIVKWAVHITFIYLKNKYIGFFHFNRGNLNISILELLGEYISL